MTEAAPREISAELRQQLIPIRQAFCLTLYLLHQEGSGKILPLKPAWRQLWQQVIDYLSFSNPLFFVEPATDAIRFIHIQLAERELVDKKPSRRRKPSP